MPVPEPTEDEVLIRVSRAGMNFADTQARQNLYLTRYELPFVPGMECAVAFDALHSFCFGHAATCLEVRG